MKNTILGFMFVALVSISTPYTAFAAMSLPQLIESLISLGVIAPDKADQARSIASLNGSTVDSCFVFTRDLSMGTTRNDVFELTYVLSQNGLLDDVRNVFNNDVKVAVVKFQANNGLPQTGYVGPLTRAKLNDRCGQRPRVGDRLENILSAKLITIDNSSVTVYPGEKMATLAILQINSRLSDVDVQRVSLGLNTFTAGVFDNLYLVDDSSQVISEVKPDLDTIKKGNGASSIAFGGFNYKVSKNGRRFMYIKADVSPDALPGVIHKIKLVSDSIRGVDIAGIDQYAPDVDVLQEIRIVASSTAASVSR